jgi:hypothetical protein
MRREARGIAWWLALLAFPGRVGQAHGGEPVAWGETVKPGRAVWIRVVPFEKGSWLSVRTQFQRNAPSRLVVAQSNDRCRTWEDLARLAQPGRHLDNGLLFRVPDGPILLACRSVAVDESSGRLLVYRGSKNGREWTLHGTIDSSEVASREIFGRGLWEPWLYFLPDRRLAAAYANEKRSRDKPPFSQVCSVRVSADGGATWGDDRLMAAQPGGGRLRPGMPVVIRLRQGTYLAAYEVVGPLGAPAYLKESADGVSWPEGLGRPVEGHQSGPFVLELDDGRILLTSCTNRISWSGDGGKTWTMAQARGWAPARLPDSTWLTWPALYDLGESEILLSTSSLGSRPYELRFGRTRPPR